VANRRREVGPCRLARTSSPPRKTAHSRRRRRRPLRELARLDAEDQPPKPRQAQDKPSKVEPLNKQSRDPLEPRAKAGRRTRVDEAEVLGLKAFERIDRQGLRQRHAHRTTAVGLELCGALRAQTVRDHAEQAHTTG